MSESANNQSSLEATGAERKGLQRQRFGPLSQLVRSIPTVLVLGALVALGFWGHHTGWTMPKFSTLVGRETIEREDWCEQHGVPESECVECKPALLPKDKDYGWCKRHGIPNCPLEHPQVAQLAATPQITTADLERAERALSFAQRPENNRKCELHERRIQFVSKEAIEKAGIDVAPVWQAPMIEAVSANGEITYDQTRVARLSARVPGTVCSVAKQVGDRVQKGEVLALVDAAEVGRAKGEFLQATVQLRLKLKTLEALQQLATKGAITERTTSEAETAVSEARIRLVSARQALINLGFPVQSDDFRELSEQALAQRIQFLGLPESLQNSSDPASTSANLLPIRATLPGLIVAREVVAGEVVDTAKVLFVVADIDQMWLTLNVRQEDARKLALGQVVRFHSDAIGHEATGKLNWLSTAVDEKTRMLKVRANLDNQEHRLRGNTFGQGRIILREEKKAVVVPNEAVHWEGDCHVVFIRDKNYFVENAPKVFHVRKVRIGARDAENTEIIAGVLPGELVASKGSGTLRGELLKNNLGEG